MSSSLHQIIEGRLPAFITLALALAGGPLYAQYDKVAALGSDSSFTPIGGPASSPPLSVERYDLPDLRPTGTLNDQLPKWLQFGLEERLRLDGCAWKGTAAAGSDPAMTIRISSTAFGWACFCSPPAGSRQ